MKGSERLALLGFRVGWWCGRWLPESLVRSVISVAGEQTWRKRGKGMRRLVFNQARVLGVSPRSPEAMAAARTATRNYFRYWAELFLQSRWSDRDIERLVAVEGVEQVEAVLDSGRGAMLLATHSGNWDLVGAWGANKFGGFTTVAERLEPVELFDEFVRHRAVRQIEILPHKGGARRPTEVLTERLNQGRLVALAADRDMSRTGVQVELFGATAKLPGGPAYLAANTGCALFPVGVWFDGKLTRVKIYPELDTRGDNQAVTQRLADAFEVILKQHPECWSMLQQVWLDHPAEWGGRG